MERDYTSSTENVYFKCRKEAALCNDKLNSREGAAELLGLSPSTLANYELGITKSIPPDAVVMMSDLYNAPELKNLYCANECPIGKCSVIATSINSIESVTVKMLKALSEKGVSGIKEQLIDIVADGKITEDELPSLEHIVGFLDELSHTLGELKLTFEKQMKGCR